MVRGISCGAGCCTESPIQGSLFPRGARTAPEWWLPRVIKAKCLKEALMCPVGVSVGTRALSCASGDTTCSRGYCLDFSSIGVL